MRKVLIDCDPGIDDALALAYLAGLHQAGEIEIMGVTTTAGNVGVGQTAANAAWVLATCGLDDVPVAPGAATPLSLELVTTPETHGSAGLGYIDGPQNRNWAFHDAQKLWNDAAGANLIVTGPLTNAARMGIEDFESVTVMGGAFNYRGNTTPTAEWNFWVDPHACQQFFRGILPSLVRLCSLEVTEKFLITPQRLEQLSQEGIGRYWPDMLRFYFEFHDTQGEGYQAQIHDLLTCMIALDKVPYVAVETTVDIEADSELLRGTSVADLRSHWNRPANTELVVDADMDAAHTEVRRILGK